MPAPTVTLHRFPGEPERAYTNDKLWTYWDQKVASLCELTDAWKGTAPERERHRIYSHLLMAVVNEYWNGNKHGRRGSYPLNDVSDPLRYDPRPNDTPYLDNDYLGHNIAALAVDVKGRIIDFDFNHNDLFNSSAEHAEARLVRRLYSLAQISEAWPAPASNHGTAESQRKVAKASLGNTSTAVGAPPTQKSYASLKEVTIYTSLESCAQCSGVMALAAVRQVVYLQTDPGTYWIGRILRSLTADPMRAPLPIGGREIEFPFFAELDEGYKNFATRNRPDPAAPFWLSPDTNGEPDRSLAITSFLCTAKAREIVARAGDLENVNIRHHSFRHVPDPKIVGHVCNSDCGLTNDEVLAYAKDFLRYAKDNGRRGTPHNL